ncbi:MAG: hypothetical protein D6744_17350 [Planctomycetota bacterium]|nr:MAG: hypothetical protein D6744_17350 [Planctomycetota bacterium]
MSDGQQGATPTTNASAGKPVVMICPNLTCRRMITAPASARGKSVRCSFCNTVFRVPQARGETG